MSLSLPKYTSLWTNLRIDFQIVGFKASLSQKVYTHIIL